MPYKTNEDIEWTTEIEISHNTSSHLYQAASVALDEARRTNNMIELFKRAAILFEKAAEELINLTHLVDQKYVNYLSVTNANYHYYLYESAKCLYAYYFKQQDYTAALLEADKAITHIENACKQILDKTPVIDDNAKEYFADVYPKWNLFKIEAPILKYEPLARQAMSNSDYIAALDNYRTIDSIVDLVYKYLSENNIDQCTKRIALANYYTTKSNVSNSLAGVIYNNPTKTNIVNVLELMLDSLNNMKKANETNPEWELYQEGVEVSQNNIEILLKKYQELWFYFYTAFEFNDEQLKLLSISMKRIDPMKYNDTKGRALSSSMSKEKKTVFYGVFWLTLIVIVFLGLYLLLKSVSWGYFITLIIAGPVIVVLPAVLILRSVGDLSEENFIRLIKLTIKLNFSLLSKKT